MNKGAWFPFFRAGRWAKMRSLVPNGDVTEQHLDEMATNGNRIIREKLLGAIPIGLDHEPKTGDAAGWIEGFQRSGSVLYFKPRWTSLGAEKLKGDAPLRRHISAEVRKNFKAGGEEGSPTIEGLSPVGAALLGRELPEMKGLTDLAGAVSFSEHDDVIVLRDTVDADDSHAVYFAEISEPIPEPITETHPMKTAEELALELETEKKKNAKLEADLAIANTEKATVAKQAELSEFRAKTVVKIDGLLAKKVMGSKAAERAADIMVQLHEADASLATFSERSNTSALEVAFSEFLDSLPPIDSNFVEIDRSKGGTEEIAPAEFSESAINPEKAQKIQRVIDARKKTDPKFNLETLRAEVMARASK